LKKYDLAASEGIKEALKEMEYKKRNGIKLFIPLKAVFKMQKPH